MVTKAAAVMLSNLDTVFDIGSLVTSKVSIVTFGPSNGVTAGSRGLVPAPATNQNSSYSLRADGTWEPTLNINSNGSLTLTYVLRSAITPQATTLLQLQGGDGADTLTEVDVFGGSAKFLGIRYEGPLAAPTALAESSEVSSFEAWGYNGVNPVGPSAALRFYASQAWTPTANGSYGRISVTPTGSTTRADTVSFENNGAVLVPPTVTGGNTGAGTINATGVYVQGAAVATLNGSGQLESSQIPSALLGTVKFQSVWNASTNTPTLTSGVGTSGDYYVVSVAGTTTIDGNNQWDVGDWIIFDGTVWLRIIGNSLPPTAVTLTATQALTNKTYNGVSITGDSSSLTVADSKSVIVNNSITLSGTDDTTYDMDTFTTITSANIFSGSNIFNSETTLAGAIYASYVGDGVYPTINNGLAITTDFSGTSEINFWNTNTDDVARGFYFYQMTGGGASNLLVTISDTGFNISTDLDISGNVLIGGTLSFTSGNSLQPTGFRNNIGDADATLLATDVTVATSVVFTAARTWQLPASITVSPGYYIIVLDVVSAISSTNTLTLTCAGSDTINNGTSLILNSPGSSGMFICDGVSRWTLVQISATSQIENVLDDISSISGGTF